MIRRVLTVLVAGLALAPAASADDRVVDRMSFGPNGGNGVVDAGPAAVSGNGRCVAFQTSEVLVTGSPAGTYLRCGTTITSNAATGLVALNNDGTCAVFVVGGAITRTCDNGAATPVASGATFGGASRDLSCIAYSTANPDATTDHDSSVDVYRRCGDDPPVQMSTTSAEIPASDSNGDGTLDVDAHDPAIDATFAALSPDGKCVAFHTTELLTATADTAERAGPDTFWFNCGDGPQTRTNVQGTVDALSTGGACVTSTSGGAILQTCGAGDAQTITSGSSPVFRGQADNGDGVVWSQGGDLYQRRGSDPPQLVDRNRSGIGPPSLPATFGGVSSDGATVAFATRASLVKDDTDASTDVYALHPGAVLFPDTPDPEPPAPVGGGSPSSGGGGGGGGASTAPRTTGPVSGLAPTGQLTTDLASTSTRDTLVPRLFGLGMEPRSIRAGRTATLQFSLTEPATITFVVERRLVGRLRTTKPKKGRKRRTTCVTTGKRATGKGRRCTVYKAAGKPVTGDAPAGLSELQFSAGTLAPGTYRITAVARDAAGNVTAPLRSTFVITR